MKLSLILIPALCIPLNLCAGRVADTWSPNNTEGHDFTDANNLFVTYKVPKDYPYLAQVPRFNVCVEGSYTGLYNDFNFWGGNVSFGSFDFANGKQVEVTVTSYKHFKTYEILPHSAEIYDVEKVNGTCIRFKTKKANQNFTFVFDNDYKGNVLHLFCNDIQGEEPNVSKKDGYSYDESTKTHYFGPGYYDLSTMFHDGRISITGNENIYLAGGAVLNGGISLSKLTTGRVYGHGMLMCVKGGLFQASQCTGGRVSGIIIHGHHNPVWQCVVSQCSNMNYDNVKVIDVRYASTDGLDVVNSQNCMFNNMFIRANDDAIAIKGLSGGREPNMNLTFNNMQLWNDCNNALTMGAETRAAKYENIKLTNSEVLFSYDDPCNHETLDERAAFSIVSLWGTYFKDILFDNIVVNRCERFIALGFYDTFWFGSLIGDQKLKGDIDGVTFRNVRTITNSGSNIANFVRFHGWHSIDTPDKYIHNITFDNVQIEGRPFDGWNNKYLQTNNTEKLKLVYDLHFINKSK
jgi:hypothetical protein